MRAKGIPELLLLLALPTALLLAPPPAPVQAAAAAPPETVPRIVNGLPTQDHPATAALLDRTSGLQFCSAVLVGCRTALTAAHCVCGQNGSLCQPGGPELVPAQDLVLFFQHAGFRDVEQVTVHPAFQFGERDDIAVLRLADPVEGILPGQLNSVAPVEHGSSARIVGFGLATQTPFDNGIKREGAIVTSACTVVPEEEYVCWEFAEPVGAPGTDSNTCAGDSGGPLLVDFGSRPLVAGIGSGGVQQACQADDSSFDADVFANLAWIQAAAGADLESPECGALPLLGGPAAETLPIEGEINAQGEAADLAFEVPMGAQALRVGLNGAEGLLLNDFDLVLSRGGPPNVGETVCASAQRGTYEFCEVLSPAPGTWNARVSSAFGQGSYQLTVTVFRELDLGPCVPDAFTLCIDDAPGDGRFEVTVAFDTSQAGGQAGRGHAIPLSPLGVNRGGLFWFFEKVNPEVLLKVLDGCSVNGFRWVFWSAGTNVRLLVTVTDRRTGRQRLYFNPDLHPAAPVTDTLAFACPP